MDIMKYTFYRFSEVINIKSSNMENCMGNGETFSVLLLKIDFFSR